MCTPSQLVFGCRGFSGSMWGTHDLHTSSWEIKACQDNYPVLEEVIITKPRINGKIPSLEKQVFLTRIEDDLTSPHTMAMMSSMDEIVDVLKKCRQTKDMACARRAHLHACHNGVETSTVLGNYLVPMFVECGCLAEGQQAFDRLIDQNEHSWTSLIQGLIDAGDSQHAFKLYRRMEHFSVLPTSFTFVALLKACAIERDQESGRELHSKIIKQGHEADTFVGNVLVDMYFKSAFIGEAVQVFQKLPDPDIVSWNTVIAGYVDHDHCEEALSCLEQMHLEGIPPNDLTFISVIKACSSIRALEKGRQIHAEIAREGYESTFHLGSTLVDMYAKCGSLVEAQEVFDSMSAHDSVSWNPLIVGYAEHGLGNEALECMEDMKLEQTLPDTVAWAGCIKACGSIGAIRKGHEIHSECTKLGVETDSFVGSALVDMYSKFAAVMDAQDVFNKLTLRGVVPWTALIGGYADCGLGQDALNCLGQMQAEGVLANNITLVCSLKACGSIESQGMGRELHIAITKRGLDMDTFIVSALVDMYAKCGALSEAQESLARLSAPGVVAWTALIAGYAEEGLNEEALHSLEQMKDQGITPNAATFVCCLKACGNLPTLQRGQESHADIAVEGFESEALVGTSLVDMYIKCGSLEQAREVFDELSTHDVAAWNAMIKGYNELELCEEALDGFGQMHHEGMTPDAITFVQALKACGNLESIGRGQEIFMQIAKEGLDEDLFIGNALIDFFTKCSLLTDAQQALDRLPVRDVVSWTSLISGYVEHDFCKEALDCTMQMKSEGLLADAGTFVCCLKACGNLEAIDTAQEIHTEVVIQGLEKGFHVGNTLVDMYAKCGRLMEARVIFDALEAQDVVSWTALIGGYSAEYEDFTEFWHCFQQMQLKGVSPDVMTWNNLILGHAERGDGAKSYKSYRQMQEQGLLPNQVTFTHSLKACGTTAALKVGKRIVAHIYGEAGLDAVEVGMENAIVDMYGRCGSMADAQKAFDAMPNRQLVTWNGLITGYARQGEIDSIFHLMSRMKNEDVQPNEVTFLCVLSACNHAGLVDQGKYYFKAMKTEYQLEGKIMHHNCMIDLLGRSGCFDEILTLLQEMPVQPNVVTWMTLLSACQTWGNSELGRRAFESVVRLDGDHIAAFVIMANIYANVNMWEEVRKIEFMRANGGVSPDAENTWIEVDGVSRLITEDEEFSCGRKKMKGSTESVSHGFQREGLPIFKCLCHEGLVGDSENTPIRIVKDARICLDCHAALADLSKAKNVFILCRDAIRIHIFKDRKCSCMYYS